jgi:hypothetical protein
LVFRGPQKPPQLKLDWVPLAGEEQGTLKGHLKGNASPAVNVDALVRKACGKLGVVFEVGGKKVMKKPTLVWIKENVEISGDEDLAILLEESAHACAGRCIPELGLLVGRAC